MQQPTQLPSRRIGTDTYALRSYTPLPGMGVLPINAYLIQAREPVLIDTGMAALKSDFLSELRGLIDLADLRWIWITHADADHVGNLRELISAAPKARIVTNFLGAGKLALQQLPLERSHLINPGQCLDVGDRQLLALRPPVYDAPETMGLYDAKSGNLFSSDCFGTLMSEPCESAAELPVQALREGMAIWTGIDAPWLAQVSHPDLMAMLQPLRAMAPRRVLSSHLPPAEGMLDALIDGLLAARQWPAFVGPDQAAVEQAALAA